MSSPPFHSFYDELPLLPIEPLPKVLTPLSRDNPYESSLYDFDSMYGDDQLLFSPLMVDYSCVKVLAEHVSNLQTCLMLANAHIEHLSLELEPYYCSLQ